MPLYPSLRRTGKKHIKCPFYVIYKLQGARHHHNFIIIVLQITQKWLHIASHILGLPQSFGMLWYIRRHVHVPGHCSSFSQSVRCSILQFFLNHFSHFMWRIKLLMKTIIKNNQIGYLGRWQIFLLFVINSTEGDLSRITTKMIFLFGHNAEINVVSWFWKGRELHATVCQRYWDTFCLYVARRSVSLKKSQPDWFFADLLAGQS